VTEIPPKAWLVRGAFEKQKDLLERWLQDGFVAIGWAEVGEAEAGTPGMSIYERVKDAYPDEPPGAWRAWTGNLNSFVNRIDAGHLVVTVAGDDVYVARVTGEATFDPSLPWSETRRRSVEWLNSKAPASRAAIVKIQYPSLYSRLRTLLTVTDLGDDVAAVAALAGLAAPPALKEPGLRPADDALAAGLHLPAAWIQSEIIDLLAEKRQVVFYGPPGTGKTYVAQRIANHLASAGGEFELVQFHPSYSYEDFFEGYRPAPAEG
jgi:5-methylcytosine-specific restriction protein B